MSKLTNDRQNPRICIGQCHQVRQVLEFNEKHNSLNSDFKPWIELRKDDLYST